MHNPQKHHAQQVLTLAMGHPQLAGPAADPSVARSWLRCLQQHNLDPAQNIPPTIIEHAYMLKRREQLQQVLEIANNEMNSLHRQLAGSGHAVLLTDASGVILNCVTNQSEKHAFEQAGLILGADWSEACEGSNGIGTCLIEQQPLTIHQNEHFNSRHIGLTCSSSPVFDPHGELLAVLDVSSTRQNVSRQSQFHTMALVNLSAKAIEGSHFLRSYQGEWLLRFHSQAEYIGQFSEALLAFDSEGRVRAVNQGALNVLGLSRRQLLGLTLVDIFDCHLDDLFGRASMQPSTSWPLSTRHGQPLFAMIRGQPQRRIHALGTAGAAPPWLCMSDPSLQKDFQRSLRVYEHDVPLLIGGETGTGKEAFAKALHQISSRGGKPFIALNCAAIPESLIESELFGYRGGSFTGARKEGMRGKLQQADGGTLFLDEIGDMPLALQTRFLRVLEERQIEPIGGETQSIDVRVISASNRNLSQMVAEGRFREDLYYRLNGLTICLPTLRERGDKLQLLQHLLREEAHGQSVHLEDRAQQALLAYHWPGNVRQLRNVLRTLVALSENGIISCAELPAEFQNLVESRITNAPAACAPLNDAERSTLLTVLEEQRWHITRSAKQLGISRNTLYRKLSKHAISPRG
ncbi:MAG: sigma-54-dependent Fis family transcriptional regulator [Pseudomonas sp.]|jgi:transcriptional regulator of acetoin/glycerol metabolism|nr:sigma-54-dependent Fis family transcriptional regulator [Pseudomonas sp.]